MKKPSLPKPWTGRLLSTLTLRRNDASATVDSDFWEVRYDHVIAGGVLVQNDRSNFVSASQLRQNSLILRKSRWEEENSEGDWEWWVGITTPDQPVLTWSRFGDIVGCLEGTKMYSAQSDHRIGASSWSLPEFLSFFDQVARSWRTISRLEFIVSGIWWMNGYRVWMKQWFWKLFVKIA